MGMVVGIVFGYVLVVVLDSAADVVAVVAQSLRMWVAALGTCAQRPW